MALKKGMATDAVSKLFSNSNQAYETCEAQQAYEAYDACRTQGKKGKRAARMTMAFSDENMDYIRTMGQLERGGATAYVNRLIEADRRKNAAVYARMKTLKESQI